MSIRQDDIGRISLHESYKRDPGPEFSAESIEAQIAAFFAKGGKVKEVPFGAMSLAPVAYKNSATRRANDISFSEKDKTK